MGYHIPRVPRAARLLSASGLAADGGGAVCAVQRCRAGNRGTEPCEIFATLRIFSNRVTVRDRFAVAMSPKHNNGGGCMHMSTWVVILLLMFGEIAVLAFAGLFLWFAGEFGEAPKWTSLRALRKSRRVP
jgi:hypothetical protein